MPARGRSIAQVLGEPGLPDSRLAHHDQRSAAGLPRSRRTASAIRDTGPSRPIRIGQRTPTPALPSRARTRRAPQVMTGSALGGHDPAREGRQAVRVAWLPAGAGCSGANGPLTSRGIGLDRKTPSAKADQFRIQVTRLSGRSRDVPGMDRQLGDPHRDQQFARSLSQRRRENLREESLTIKSRAQARQTSRGSWPAGCRRAHLSPARAQAPQ